LYIRLHEHFEPVFNEANPTHEPIVNRFLGATVKDKNTWLTSVLKGVAGLKLVNFDDSEIDIFGDAYEFLINNYAGLYTRPCHMSLHCAQ